MWDTRYRRRALRSETLAESVSAATLAASAATDGEPTVLLYSPPARGNPYQQLLYTRAAAHGIIPVPMHDLEELDGLRWPYPLLLHIHWTSPIIQPAADLDDAFRRADAAIASLSAALERGTRLVWTVHNVLPHECRWAEPEEKLRQWFADHASMVHVMGAGTADLVEPHYRLPDDGRTVPIGHPSYVGVYPDHVERAEARYELGLPADAKVAAKIGSIRAYKGTDVMVDALRRLDDDWRFVVAGKPIDDDADRTVEELMYAEPRLEVWPRHVETEEMQLFLRAADLVVLPYLDGLNSGVCPLAMTFGRPLVVAASGNLPEVVTADVGAVVPPGDAAALADAIVDVYDRREALGAGAAAAAEAMAPATVSDRFFEALVARLG